MAAEHYAAKHYALLHKSALRRGPRFPHLSSLSRTRPQPRAPDGTWLDRKMALRDWTAGHIVGIWVVGLGSAWLMGRFGIRAVRGGAGGGIALLTTSVNMMIAAALLFITLRWFRARMMR